MTIDLWAGRVVYYTCKEQTDRLKAGKENNMIINIHDVPREIRDNGEYGILYGFNWETKEAIYRFVANGKADYRSYKMQ